MSHTPEPTVATPGKATLADESIKLLRDSVQSLKLDVADLAGRLVPVLRAGEVDPSLPVGDIAVPGVPLLDEIHVLAERVDGIRRLVTSLHSRLAV